MAGSDTISSIFAGAEVDQGIASIFGKSAGPIDSKKLISKRVRTVLPKIATEEVSPESSSEDAEEQEEVQPEKKKQKRQPEGEDPDLEAKYFSKLIGEEEEEGSDKETEPAAATTTKPVKTTAAKTIDLKKDELEKAESTIFVGNLPSSVIDDKNLNKKLKKHFEAFGKIKSIRFRSIAFTDNLPRKVAFIQKKLDSNVDTVNAYVVFEQKSDSLKAMELNGTVFAEHHIRVDHLTHPLKQDNKRSIFVGNLDFQEKEENLWKFFESKVGAGEIENVRIIRDPKTNFGKGFAIIQFKDFAQVNKALLLNDKPLSTSAKPRKLRITRCKKIQPKASAPVSGKNLSEKDRTLIGRGKKILNKSDRATIGKTVVEGERAVKGRKISGIKNGLGKKPRIRERSTNFKKARHDKK